MKENECYDIDFERILKIKKDGIIFDENETPSIILINPKYIHNLSGSIRAVANFDGKNVLFTGDRIFHEGESANKLYSLLKGRVALDVEKSPGANINVKHIVPGSSFGISSLVDDQDKKCMTGAVALQDSTMVVWDVADLNRIFDEEPVIGFLFMKGATRVLKGRLQSKNTELAESR